MDHGGGRNGKSGKNEIYSKSESTNPVEFRHERGSGRGVKLDPLPGFWHKHWVDHGRLREVETVTTS